MGVDVSSIAGFTVSVSDEVWNKFPKYEDRMEICEALRLSYSTIGSAYTGKEEIILILEPESGVRVDYQIECWLNEVNSKLKTNYSPHDVKFISETHWY